MAFEWDPNQTLLTRKQGEAEYCWIPKFQQFGRIRLGLNTLVSRLFSLIIEKQGFPFSDDIVKEFKAMREKLALPFSCSVVGETTYDGNASAKIIEVKIDGHLIATYHIDVDRGYLCPYMCAKDQFGKITGEAKSGDYFAEKNTGLYYPRYHIESAMEFRLVPDALRLNIPVSDEEFAIDIPKAHWFLICLPTSLCLSRGGNIHWKNGRKS
jgi:hypothetical protein